MLWRAPGIYSVEVEQEGEWDRTDAGGGGVLILILEELASDPKMDVFQRVHSRVNVTY